MFTLGYFEAVSLGPSDALDTTKMNLASIKQLHVVLWYTVSTPRGILLPVEYLSSLEHHWPRTQPVHIAEPSIADLQSFQRSI